MPRQHIYIDSNILMFYFEKRKPRRDDRRENARQSITHITRSLNENDEIKVIISQIVLGELMMHSCNGKCDLEQIGELLRDLHVDGSNLPSVSFDALLCAQEIHDSLRRIEPNDALLVSQALKDPDTTWLLTTDKLLIGNPVIERKMEENHRFTIAYSY